MLSRGYQTNSQPSRKITEIRGGGGGRGGGVYDKHPLELGGYSKSALHGGYGYFLELHKVVYLGIYSVFL